MIDICTELIDMLIKYLFQLFKSVTVVWFLTQSVGPRIPRYEK